MQVKIRHNSQVTDVKYTYLTKEFYVYLGLMFHKLIPKKLDRWQRREIGG